MSFVITLPIKKLLRRQRTGPTRLLAGGLHYMKVRDDMCCPCSNMDRVKANIHYSDLILKTDPIWLQGQMI